jgi:signal transduction histidine kinase
VWNDAGAGLELRIQPYYWETGWFRISLVLVLIAGIAGFVRHLGQQAFRRELERLERQRDMEQDRARIARDIHDHIGSGLTRINLLNELLLGEPPSQLARRVSQITGVTCELMRTMDEIVWAVNPKNDTLESLMNYVCDYADEFLRPAGISLRLRVPARLPGWSLTSEVRHNLFLAVKEILNNIVKHAAATEVTLELRLNASTATLEIQDNGRGLERQSPVNGHAGPRPMGGNGLENLRKRAAAIGGQCRIQSEQGRGTRIGLVLPAPRLNGQH